jgi:hypothetical protein
VDLPDRDKPASRIGHLVLKSRPAANNLVDRLLAGEAEVPGVASGGECTNPPTLEVGDYLFRYITHA